MSIQMESDIIVDEIDVNTIGEYKSIADEIDVNKGPYLIQKTSDFCGGTVRFATYINLVS